MTPDSYPWPSTPPRRDSVREPRAGHREGASRFVIIALVIALATTGLITVQPAYAGAGDTDGNRGNCAMYEYKAIHKGDSLHRVRQILGGKGIVQVPGRKVEVRRWGKYFLNPNRHLCMITFTNDKVSYKSRI